MHCVATAGGILMLELSKRIRSVRRPSWRFGALMALPAMLAFATCKASNDGSDTTRGSSRGAGPGSGGAGGINWGVGGEAGGGTLHVPDTLTCAENDQSLLIIDLRSGWWSGDGGDYHTVVLDRIAKAADPVTNV